MYAALALKEFGPEAAIAEAGLRQHLGDPSPRVRELCCEVLAAPVHCGLDTIAKLKLATHDSDPKVRAAAEQALTKLQFTDGRPKSNSL